MRDSPTRTAQHALALGRALRTRQRVRIELRDGVIHEGEVLHFAEHQGRIEAVAVRTLGPPGATVVIALALIDRVHDSDEATARTAAQTAHGSSDRPTTPPPANADATVRMRPLRVS